MVSCPWNVKKQVTSIRTSEEKGSTIVLFLKHAVAN